MATLVKALSSARRFSGGLLLICVILYMPCRRRRSDPVSTISPAVFIAWGFIRVAWWKMPVYFSQVSFLVEPYWLGYRLTQEHLRVVQF